MMVTIKKEISYTVEMNAQQKENLIIFLMQAEKTDSAFMSVNEIYGAAQADDVRETVVDLLRSLEGL